MSDPNRVFAKGIRDIVRQAAVDMTPEQRQSNLRAVRAIRDQWSFAKEGAGWMNWMDAVLTAAIIRATSKTRR